MCRHIQRYMLRIYSTLTANPPEFGVDKLTSNCPRLLKVLYIKRFRFELSFMSLESDSKSSGGNTVSVRPRSPAPISRNALSQGRSRTLVRVPPFDFAFRKIYVHLFRAMFMRCAYKLRTYFCGCVFFYCQFGIVYRALV